MSEEPSSVDFLFSWSVVNDSDAALSEAPESDTSLSFSVSSNIVSDDSELSESSLSLLSCLYLLCDYDLIDL